ncbi:MAG TPA: N-acetylgalactosamine 6-sulfate sulfatase [Planctomycetaceae bacterium]|nr:N-acetylgalactosamine 6-sulfate sulfatase [Planctomycetaceae bacterium]
MAAVMVIGWAAPDAAAGAGTTGEAHRRPNVLVILADDLGYGDLSSFGAEDIDTPHLDRLVASGMKLTQFYANSPVCSPTRASLLTGCYPDAVGVPGVIRTHARNSWGYLDPQVPLLPAVLKAAGYRTAMVGKWHLGLAEPNLPNSRGFDSFHGFLGDMMDDYFNHRRHGINYMRRNRQQIDPPGHATDLFTRWACQWLEGQDGRQPFFLYLAYNAPHSPIQPPQEYLARYHARHPDVPPKRARFAALVEHLDAGVGQVLQALERSGRAGNTLVLFSSDNGGAEYFGSDNGPLAGGKQEMLEGGIRVPAAAVWPGRIRPGSSCDRVALTMDLFATICQAANASIDHPIDGRSILDTLLGKPQPPEDRYLFWVRLEGGRRYGGQPYYAARHGDWKLLQNSPSEPFRLYHLAEDPTERSDLASRHPDVAARLKKALDAHIARCADIPWRGPDGKGPGEID